MCASIHMKAAGVTLPWNNKLRYRCENQNLVVNNYTYWKKKIFFFLKYALKSAKPSHTWAVEGGQAQVPLLAHGPQEAQQEQGSRNHSRVHPCICDGFKLSVRLCGDLGKMWILATVPDSKYLGNTEPGGSKYISGVSFSRRKNSIKLSLRQVFKRIKGNSLVIRH